MLVVAWSCILKTVYWKVPKKSFTSYWSPQCFLSQAACVICHQRCSRPTFGGTFFPLYIWRLNISTLSWCIHKSMSGRHFCTPNRILWRFRCCFADRANGMASATVFKDPRFRSVYCGWDWKTDTSTLIWFFLLTVSSLMRLHMILNHRVWKTYLKSVHAFLILKPDLLNTSGAWRDFEKMTWPNLFGVHTVFPPFPKHPNRLSDGIKDLDQVFMPTCHFHPQYPTMSWSEIECMRLAISWTSVLAGGPKDRSTLQVAPTDIW